MAGKELINAIGVDLETDSNSLKVFFEADSVDCPASGDPLQIHANRTVAKIKDAIVKLRISKRFNAEDLKTAKNLVRRSLNPAVFNMNFNLLYKIVEIVGLKFGVHVKEVV